MTRVEENRQINRGYGERKWGILRPIRWMDTHILRTQLHLLRTKRIALEEDVLKDAVREKCRPTQQGRRIDDTTFILLLSLFTEHLYSKFFTEKIKYTNFKNKLIISCSFTYFYYYIQVEVYLDLLLSFETDLQRSRQ